MWNYYLLMYVNRMSATMTDVKLNNELLDEIHV